MVRDRDRVSGRVMDRVRFRVRVRVRRQESSGNLLLRRKLHYAPLAGPNIGHLVHTYDRSQQLEQQSVTISGKVAVGIARDSQNFSRHPYIGRIARSSLR